MTKDNEGYLTSLHSMINVIDGIYETRDYFTVSDYIKRTENVLLLRKNLNFNEEQESVFKYEKNRLENIKNNFNTLYKINT
jgi:hypothetical protein